MTSAKIKANAVKSPKIADGAVIDTKIADGAVTNTKIADGAVTDAKITGPISGSKISGDISGNAATATNAANADTVDNMHAADFVDLTSNQTIDGTKTFTNTIIFEPSLGNKISLWGDYGLGIQSYVLQIHTDIIDSDIVFGYGKSESFTENMRVKGNGKVGIGTTSPAEKLSVAGNITATGNVVVGGSLTYGAAKTRHWSITGAGLIPYQASTPWSKGWSILYGTTGTFTAPVHLPDGAVITKMTVHYYDNSADDYAVRLWRVAMNGVFDDVARFDTSGAAAGFQAGSVTAITNGIVDNSLYAYDLFVFSMDGTGNHQFGGATIEYTVTDPLP